jgi:hypothetical protein
VPAAAAREEEERHCWDRDFFTVGYRAVYRGNHCYRWGTVTVSSGSNRYRFSNLNLNLKMKKSIKISKK